MDKIIKTLLEDVRLRGKFDYKQAVQNGIVKFEPIGQRYHIYINGEFVNSWQASTAMLFYQKLAAKLEKRF